MGVRARWREREGERGGRESTRQLVCVKICLDFFSFSFMYLESYNFMENNMLQCDALYLCFY